MAKDRIDKLEIISDVLNRQFLCPEQTKLIEVNKDEKGKSFECCYNVIENNIPYWLYKFDVLKHETLFQYFSDESGLKKLCDYILFAEENGFMYVFLIELKKSPQQTKPQLDASQAFAEYIIASAKRIGKIIDNNIVYLKIRIIDKNVSKKRKPNESKNISFDKDNYCNYPYSVFRIKQLINKYISRA